MTEQVPQRYALGHLLAPQYDEVRTFGCEVHPLREQVGWHQTDEDRELEPRWWNASFSFLFRGLPCVVETLSKPQGSGRARPPHTTLAVLTSPRPGYVHPYTAPVENWQSTVLPGELVSRSADAAALRAVGFHGYSGSWVLDVSQPLIRHLEAFHAIPWKVLRPTDLPDGLYADSSCMMVFFDEFACWDARTVKRSALGMTTEFTYGDRTISVTAGVGGTVAIRSWFGAEEPGGGHIHTASVNGDRFAKWACGRERPLLEELPAFFEW